MFTYVYARKHATDPRYTFGTGKVGALGGFGSAVGLAVVALLVVSESAVRLASPSAIRFDEAEHHNHDHSQHHDHNLRGAYLHVLADALTSVLAIVALFAGKALGWNWLDPVTGVVGGLVIARWSLGLLRDTSAVLLDGEVSELRKRTIRESLEAEADNRVVDLHVWRVGPRHLAAIVSVVTAQPRPPAHYRAILASQSDLVHVTVEVHSRDES